MRLKLDENITIVAKDPLLALGHDVDTVPPDNVVSVLQGLAENHDLNELAGCVVVVTEGLIRIRWPE